ncbi:MAG: glycosyltransferase, partial [Anaerolineales bacterium]
HKLLQQMMWMASSDPVKQFWMKQFGRLPDGFGNPFPKQTLPSYPTIVSCSEHVFPTPNDWSPHIHNTGFWFLDEKADWEPSAELLSFLQSGPAPIYVGFGSLSDSATADQTTDLVIDALKRSGQRGILATGWNGMTKRNDLPETIFMLESAPHSWLFPRMAAVVHHGGAGTTAAGFRAGVPSIIIPHSNDQFAWARRAYELGVGPKPVYRKQLTAQRLAEAIRFALADHVKEAAKELGKKIQNENGVEIRRKDSDRLFKEWEVGAGLSCPHICFAFLFLSAYIQQMPRCPKNGWLGADLI